MSTTPTLTPEEIILQEQAYSFIKRNKNALIKKFADPNIYKRVDHPVSLFMAGSPGAGKTEVSKGLVRRFIDVPVRIDADEIRSDCVGYIGTNAHVFQKAATKGVNILYDYVLHNGINCILDGTFAYGNAKENVNNSLKHKRIVEIWFVYQDPVKAWELTKAREYKESRRVLKEVFVEAFFRSKDNASAVKNDFGDRVELNLLIKDYENSREDFKLSINSEQLDQYISDGYSKDTLLGTLV